MTLLYSPQANQQVVRQSSQGFSLVEVLVSVLMIVSFLAIAMQTLIAATAIKVKSEEISDSTAWMQDDLEAIKFEANRLDSTLPTPPSCGTYANALRTEIASLPQVTTLPNGRQFMVKTSGERQYILERDLNENGNLLGITHRVFRDVDKDGAKDDASDDAAIGELYSEIIPDAAFGCLNA
ncbi:MAG: hypothetical protein HC810_04910 [Acaryochloridaceae cyanobacterium RL_2_7]|nr:hypothetical protein [Acaryochloridaceae cyanobacterium RL_2_7]